MILPDCNIFDMKEGIIIIADINILKPHPTERGDLYRIWQSSFSVDDMELFFTYFYDCELCRVAVVDDKPVAMGFLIPVGNLIDSTGRKHPCAHIYAIATLPEFQGKGLASAIVKQLIKVGMSGGYTAIALRPAEESLFKYYDNNSPFCDWFYYIERCYDFDNINSADFPNCDSTNNIEISRISAERYTEMRNILLRDNMPGGFSYVELSAFALGYQEKICDIFGGALYLAEYEDGFALLTVELQPDETVQIKEFLSSADYKELKDNIISVISKIHPARKYITRAPVYDIKITAGADCIKKFAMLAALPGGITDINTPAETSAPWCGLAFD